MTRPLISTSGRKLAARAAVDIGATSHVDSGSWSDWTTTTYREPDCSWPRALRGAYNRKTSPRTQRLHVTKHLHGLGPVRFVCGEFLRFGANRRGRLSASGLDQGRPNGRGYGRPVPGQNPQRPRCVLIRSKSDRVRHNASVLQNVRQLPYSPRPAVAVRRIRRNRIWRVTSKYAAFQTSRHAPPPTRLASATRGLCQGSTVRGVEQTDDSTRLGIGRRSILIGVDEVRHRERAAVDGSPGVLGKPNITLSIGDVGDGCINPHGRAKINLCLVRCRTVDDRDGHHAGIGRRRVS